MSLLRHRLFAWGKKAHILWCDSSLKCCCPAVNYPIELHDDDDVPVGLHGGVQREGDPHRKHRLPLRHHRQVEPSQPLIIVSFVLNF